MYRCLRSEPIIYSDVARSNQCGLSVMKGGRGMSIQILNFLANDVPCSARTRLVPISHRTPSGSCQDALLTPFAFTVSVFIQPCYGTRNGRPVSEWRWVVQLGPHVVEKKHCAFFIAAGKAICCTREIYNNSRSHKKIALS